MVRNSRFSLPKPSDCSCKLRYPHETCTRRYLERESSTSDAGEEVVNLQQYLTKVPSGISGTLVRLGGFKGLIHSRHPHRSLSCVNPAPFLTFPTPFPSLLSGIGSRQISLLGLNEQAREKIDIAHYYLCPINPPRTQPD